MSKPTAVTRDAFDFQRHGMRIIAPYMAPPVVPRDKLRQSPRVADNPSNTIARRGLRARLRILLKRKRT